jgi:hypothetical protein
MLRKGMIRKDKENGTHADEEGNSVHFTLSKCRILDL